MSVQVTLVFNTVEEAIVALGKVGGITKSTTQLPPAAPKPAEPLPIAETSSTAQAAVAASVPAAAGPDEAPKRQRKPRADAGVPRGPYKDKTIESPAPAGEANVAATVPQSSGAAPAASGVSETAAQPAPATSTPVGQTPMLAAAAVPAVEEVQKAVEKLFAAKDYDGTKECLARFGVKRGQDLMPDQRAEFIAKVNRVVDQGEAI